MGISAQRTRNSGKASPGRLAQGLHLLEWRSRHSATEVWMPSIKRAHGDHRPRHHGQQHHDQVVPEGLLVLVAVGGEALQVVLEEKFAEEGGILVLHGDEPGQHHGEVEQRRPATRRIAAGCDHSRRRKAKAAMISDGQKRRHRPLGQRGQRR